MYIRITCAFFALALSVYATIFSTVRGIVHDPSHRPIAGARVTLRASGSAYTQTMQTRDDGSFEFPAVPAGEYRITASHPGFAPEKEVLTAISSTSPVLHFQLELAQQKESVTVAASPVEVNSESTTPTTMVDRQEIQRTPGANLSNSYNMITDFVPGAYMTHDQLHVRGGHQVTWALDGVPIPNTNIANSVGAPVDPENIDTLEVQRGGYSAEYGDRTYGIFDIVPRTGFETDRQLDIRSTYGTFHQTNDQISFGDHTERFAYFGSLTGNRSDYGLETPGPEIQHDRVWGIGGFGSLIYNPDPANQLRFVVSSRADDYQIPDTQDLEVERNTLATFTWVHTFSPSLLLTVAPFMNFTRADYNGDPNTVPVSTTQHLDSTYAGGQISVNGVTGKHNARAGIYAFAQHDDEFIHLLANDGSGNNILTERPVDGALEAAFFEDQFKITPWFTVTGGLRLTHFSGTVSENAADPRVGAALRIPHLNWVLHGYYGAYYQAPPLSTVSGPLLDFAVSEGLGVIPLKGERDEENQAGLTVPFRGWTFDFNSFRLRATNYFDHNALGNSNVFFPITIAGARIRGEEVTVRSPRLFHRGQASLAYSHQHAEGEGAVTGGLTDFSPPSEGYFLLDHDQRDTLHANFDLNLPRRSWIAGGLYYGSGFVDGEAPVPAHLQPHTTFDLSLGKSFGESWSVSVNGLNIANRRFLLDNSETFGGTHYADPRQIWVQVQYRFHF
ncbi:MAG TPA: TonB-dependent receptor [Bryobacteraceae bacterium]|nr:TonB-dependent receptor [Bryobacteraceae bacterium]